MLETTKKMENNWCVLRRNQRWQRDYTCFDADEHKSLGEFKYFSNYLSCRVVFSFQNIANDQSLRPCFRIFYNKKWQSIQFLLFFKLKIDGTCQKFNDIFQAKQNISQNFSSVLLCKNYVNKMKNHKWLTINHQDFWAFLTKTRK